MSKTSYSCIRCNRELHNDPRKEDAPLDTVTPNIGGRPILASELLQGVKPPTGAVTFTHDGCGGLVTPRSDGQEVMGWNR